MKYSGDIFYILRFVGADLLIVSAAIVITVFASLKFFMARRGRKK